jgi:gliding motility-associated protein GldM
MVQKYVSLLGISMRFAAPNVVISPTKMNVFYLGVDNPVEISIPGVSMDRTSATINRGTIRRDGQGFVVSPGQGNTCDVTVFAEIDGQRRNMGTRTFRIKRVPPPLPSVQGVVGRNVEKNVLAAALAMQAQMPPDFDFDMRFRVTAFTVSATIGGFLQEQASNNQMFTEEQKRLINNLRVGQVVNITNIKAVGPDGNTVDLNDLVLRIQ